MNHVVVHMQHHQCHVRDNATKHAAEKCSVLVVSLRSHTLLQILPSLRRKSTVAVAPLVFSCQPCCVKVQCACMQLDNCAEDGLCSSRNEGRYIPLQDREAA